MKFNLKAGFTLIELLVVIGIIAILAALLLGTISAIQGKARRSNCLNNLRQINMGVRMYSDDANDKSPGRAAGVKYIFAGYKELMKNYVGLNGTSSKRDRLFACPADVYYYDYCFGKRNPAGPWEGYVPESWCAESNSDFTSYVFNAGNLWGRRRSEVSLPGIADAPLSSIKHPSRTVLVTEAPALFPFSWHRPKRPLYLFARENCPSAIFNNAMNMVSFVDGHVSYTKIYWNNALPADHVFRPACSYDPPDGYDYQWTGN